MSTWLVPRDELTTEQIRAIELDPSEHRVILGGPGSGKTQILLHRAQYLRDRFKVPTGRFHIFVFTRVLKTYIQSALELLDLPSDTVSTLDAWCRTYYQAHIGRHIPWDHVNRTPDFVGIRQAVLRDVKLQRSKTKALDFVLVDEGQDLDQEAFELLGTLSNHVTVCIDYKQQIYDQGSDVTQILQTLGIRRTNLTLLEMFRCCPYIVQLAGQLIENADERRAYIQQTRTAQIERETPVLYHAVDIDDEKRQLIEVVRVRLAKGERIAVLFPMKRQVYGFAQGLKAAGVEVGTPDDTDFASDTPKLIPYHSAKGLTFDAVLLPRLTATSFGTMSLERMLRILFVGITRATNWVYMSTTKAETFAPLQRFSAIAAEGLLTIRKRGATGDASPQPLAETVNGDDDILDLL